MSNSLMLDGEKSPKALLWAHTIQLLFFTTTYIAAGLQIATTASEAKILNLLLSVLVAILAISYGLYVLIYFCVYRHDVFGLKRRTSHRRQSHQASSHQDMTSNLVELCPRPLPPITNHDSLSRGGFIYDARQPPSNSYATSSLQQQRPRIKDVNVLRDSDMDNDNNHLRRGFRAPMNSEVDYSSMGPPSLFGPSSKVNNHNIYPGMADKQPQTSSPANSHIPYVQADLTVSPLILTSTDPTQPYSIVPVAQYNKMAADMSLNSVDTGGLNYTESSTIKMGAPCGMATFDLAPPSSAASLFGPSRRLLDNIVGGGPMTTSSSLPRSIRGHRTRRTKQDQDQDQLETQSKFSIGSSTRSGHSKASGKKRHKRPNRRRPRQVLEDQPSSLDGRRRVIQDHPGEPLYNNVVGGVDDNYLGDDDDQQVDSLERQSRRKVPLPDELPSVIQEDDDDLDLDVDEEVNDDDELSQGREEPASIEDLLPEPLSPSPTTASSQLPSMNDLPKRETSV
jgi:hypothetical protein